MKATLIRHMRCIPSKEFPSGEKPSGTLIDHPEAYRLVQMGVALPADDECEQKAAMTEERLAAARHAYERTSKGIRPEDFAAFDSGQMVGYAPNGEPIPGPHAITIPDDDE